MELVLDKRDAKGTRESRRLRRKGVLPAVLYGHGEPAVTVQVSEKAMLAVLKAGHHVIKVRTPDGEAQALIRDLGWNHLGDHLLHVDFNKVRLDEEVEVEVPVETVGDAKGVLGGGILTLVHARVRVRCLAGDVPDKLVVDVTALEIGAGVTVAQMVLPAGVTVVVPASEVVATVQAPKIEEVKAEEAEPGVLPVQPELIRERKPEEGEEEGAGPEKADKGDKKEKKGKE